MADERTLVLIRERTFLDLLDLSLVVARSKPLPLGLAALLGILPFELFNTWMTSETTWPAPWLALVLLEAPLATAPLTLVLGGLMFGRKASAGRIAAGVGRASLCLLLYQGAVRAMFLITLVLSPLLPARWLFVNEVILLEHSPWPKVLGRSARLSRDRGAELVGVMLGQIAFAFLLVLGAQRAATVVAQVVTSQWSFEGRHVAAGPPGWVFRTTVWLSVAFFAITRFLTYIDQRIRLEGWEIALRLRHAGAAMEEDGRW